jgi:3-deoxy-D-manno-octulosonic acid kinase
MSDLIIQPQQARSADSHFFYDAALISQPDDAFFEADHWRKEGALLSTAQGRGAACIFTYGGGEYVLRHYRRGGLMARLSDDRYHWSGLEQTRPWREWFLLSEMYRQGLPVPRPVAARVVRCGLFYTADLVTQRLQQVMPLADMLMVRELSEQQWREIGITIKRFHQAGFYHADLNARNILMDEDGRVFVIDFDKGEKRAPEQRWQRENLERLQRSLLKFKKSQPQFWFDEQCWQWLLAGYDEISIR